METKKMTATQVADEATRIGKKLTYGVTIPMFLFILGVFCMPFGILLWILAVGIFISIFSNKNHADS